MPCVVPPVENWSVRCAGRVCEAGSVHVDEYMVTETYAHVHHIVSNVRGTLRADANEVTALRALFPVGTITG